MNRRVTHIFGEAFAFLDRSRKVGWTESHPRGRGGRGYLRARPPRPGVDRRAVGRRSRSISPSARSRATPCSRSRAAWRPTRSRSLSRSATATGPREDRVAERVLDPAARHPPEHPRARLHARARPRRSSRLFPRSNVGLELAAVLMIFTGQAWNMTFSFYHSLAVDPARPRRGGHAVPVRLVAARSAGSSCPFAHDRAGLEQHDEHGRRAGSSSWSARPSSSATSDFRLPGSART